MHAPEHEPEIPRFARITVETEDGGRDVGTTLWFDREYGRHVVLVDGKFRFLAENELLDSGHTAPPQAFLGTRSEICFDVVGQGGGPYSEGCLRRLGTFWECFFVRPTAWQHGEPSLPRVETSTWRSGIVGHLVEVEEGFECTHAAVELLLCELLGVDAFEPVDGPSSMWLK